ncbi:MAG TPA: hypothetical protein VKI99_14625 [Candidatus Dormibacteraeota bacterium]|nr:hypothetical protein [Candidatus Dormibacteraeota bacterium]
MPDRRPAGPFPDGFAADLARLLAPGETDAAAEVIAQAALLDDRGLGEFLDRFAHRVGRSAAPITAAELWELLPVVRSDPGGAG